MAFDLDGARNAGYSDDEIAEFLARERNFDFKAAIDSGYSPRDVLDHLTAEPEPKSGVARRVGDLGVALAEGVVRTPDIISGVNELAWKAHPAGVLASRMGFKPTRPEELGIRTKDAAAAVGEFYSPEEKEARAALDKAEGVSGTIGTLAEHPSLIATKAAESVPAMFMGGAIGRAMGAASPVLAGATGEGLVGGASSAEEIRQASGGELSNAQAATAAGSGFLTGLLGAAGGKLAKHLGIADVDSLMTGATTEAKKVIARRVIGGAISEGLLEEFPQSLQEQIAQNVATGKPWDEGLGKAGAMGAVVGGVMGAGANVRGGEATSPPPVPPASVLNASDVDSALAAAEAELDSTYTSLPSEAEMAVERRQATGEAMSQDIAEIDQRAAADEAARHSIDFEAPTLPLPSEPVPEAPVTPGATPSAARAYDEFAPDNSIPYTPSGKDPETMTMRELVMGAKLTRSDERRDALSAEIERRAQEGGEVASPPPSDVANPQQIPTSTEVSQQEAADARAVEVSQPADGAANDQAQADLSQRTAQGVAAQAQEADRNVQEAVDGAPVQAPAAQEAPAAPGSQPEGAGPAQTAQGAPASYRDYTAPKTVGKVIKGSIRTFPTERGAKIFRKAQNLKGWEPRQTEDGWVLSKPVRERTAAQKANDAALRANAKQVRQDDDLLTVLAKSGGMLQAEVDGADPKDIASVNKGAFGKPFTKNRGLTADGVAESLAGQGFDVLDEAGRPDASKAMELVHRAISGEKVYTPEGSMMRASAEARAAQTAGLPAGTERRSDRETRKRVDEMSQEEMRRELLIDRKTGIGNERAWLEARERTPKKHIASIDADGLKWINDNMGHQQGDRLLGAIGQAIAAEGLDGYHVSGDEFMAQFDDEDQAREAMQRVRDRLDEVEIVATLQDGSKATLKGVGFSYGLGQDIESAEGELKRDKSERTEEGKRSGRGEPPPGLAREPTQSAREPRSEASAEVAETPADAGVSASEPFALEGETESEIRAKEERDRANSERDRKRDPGGESPLSVDDVRRVVESASAKWKNGPAVKVIKSFDEAPKEVRDENEGQSAKGAEGRPYAFLHDGTAYIVADEVRSPKQAAEGLFHEALGHHGLNGVFGDKIQSVLKQVASGRRADVEAKAAQYGLDLANEEDRLLAAEEVLAELAQTKPDLGVVKRAIAAVRTWLREAGLDLEWTDADIIANFIVPAREFVERGHKASYDSKRPTFHRAYHGTPHDFETFSTEKIGTGEGAQAYGFGLYFAGKREVAEFYRDKLSQRAGRRVLVRGKPFQSGRANVSFYGAHLETMISNLVGGKSFDEAKRIALEDLREREQYEQKAVEADKYNYDTVGPHELDLRGVRDAIRKIGALQEGDIDIQKAGRLFEVELAPKEDEYLDWDAKLAEQSPRVAEILKNADFNGDPVIAAWKTNGAWAHISGRNLYSQLAGGMTVGAAERGQHREASRYLASIGIPGIKYLDGSSRGRGEGHHNFVIFEDRHVEVKAKFSRSKQPDWATSDALKSAAGKVDTYAQGESFSDKVKALKGQWKDRLVQGMFDAYAPLKKLGHKEYVKARMVKAADGALEGLLLYGKPVMSDEGVIQGQIDHKGFLGAMQDLKGEHDRFFMWIAGNRADMLMRQGREHLFTAAEIAEMRGLADGKMSDGSSRKAAYSKAAEVLRAYNKAVLDIAEKTGLIDPEGRKAWEHDFYIPFYRVDDDMTISAPSGKVKGLVRQQAFKKLKGGTEPLGDLLDNTLRNWSHLISASMANQAAVASLKAAEKVGVAEEVPEGTDGATYAMVNGKKTYYEVSDPFILQAISAMESPSFKGLPMKLMGKAKHYLTLGVTVSPTFRIRNLLRDSIAAIGQNDMNYNIMSNLAQGWTGTKRDSDTYAQMLFSGALMRFGQLTDGKHAEHAKRLIASGVKDETILTNPEKVKAALGKLWDEYQEFGDRMENINRAALYKKLKAEGKSDGEAAFAARDAMDFSLQGSWVAIRFLSQIVPFLNARLQGLYKMGRAAQDDPKRLGYVAGAVALASIALLLAYEDDDEWKKREDWDRDAFWAFRIGDVMYRIPKPFEIGAIGTLAERSVELMRSKEMGGARFAERLKSMVMETFSMNPMPQLFKPMVDLYANKDSFTGRQIETRGMEKLSKSERSTPYTSLVAKAIGKADVLSPVQVDHLIRGYFGWLGTHAAMTADLMAQPFMDAQKPARRLDDIFILGDFVKELPSDRSRYVEQFYKQAKAVHEVMGDLKHAREAKDAERVKEILKEKKSEISLNHFYSSAERRMSSINAQIRRVHASSRTADEKRAELDRLTAMRNQLAKTVDERTRRAREAAAPGR